MPRLILHMGTAKTGTSLLQSFFVKNVLKLEQNGLVYPNNGTFDLVRGGQATSGNGAGLAKSLKGDPNAKDISLHEYGALKARLNREDRPNILYSSEAFDSATKDELTRLRDMVEEADYTVEAVFYVRSASGYASSQYSQLVRRHNYTKDFNSYLKDDFNLQFIGMIQSCLEVFGQKSLRLFNYDVHKPNLTDHFVKTVLNLNPEDYDPIPGRVNSSPSPLILDFMRALNANGLSEESRKTLTHPLHGLEPSHLARRKLSRRNVEHIKSAVAIDLRYINSLNIDRKAEMIDATFQLVESDITYMSDVERGLLTIFASLLAPQS